MNNNKSIYYQAVLKGKPIKIEKKDNRNVKKEKFNKIKQLVPR